MHFDTLFADGKIREAIQTVEQYIELHKLMRLQKPLVEAVIDEELVNALYSLYSLTKQIGLKSESLKAFRECEK